MSDSLEWLLNFNIGDPQPISPPKKQADQAAQMISENLLPTSSQDLSWLAEFETIANPNEPKNIQTIAHPNEPKTISRLPTTLNLASGTRYRKDDVTDIVRVEDVSESDEESESGEEETNSDSEAESSTSSSSNSNSSDESENSDNSAKGSLDSVKHEDYRQQNGGRKSNNDIKRQIFREDVMTSLENVLKSCSRNCPLKGTCNHDVSVKDVYDARISYFGAEDEAAFTDRERAKLILNYLKKSRKDSKGNLVFKVGEKEVCTPAFLRILGVMSDVEESKAPGQWLRLIKGYKEGLAESMLLTKKDLKLDKQSRQTKLIRRATTYILRVVDSFSDTLPAIPSENSSTEIRQVPYRYVKDCWTDYIYYCEVQKVLKSNRASYATFLRAWNKLHEDEIVRLMTGKGGFNTCGYCNRALSIKKSASCKRDEITLEAVKKWVRIHLLQQQTERQHADNFLEKCEQDYDDTGNPKFALIDIDGQTVITGDTPKWTKENKSQQNNKIENRNIGVHMVCGPINEYVSISTNDTIPGGANVMIEVTRMAIEILAEKLAAIGLVLPKVLGVQYDNCGENKNKENHCFMSQLIEECYFDKIEVFYLIVGHTHNILDQWFSVLSKAIRAADFIGSVLALHALYKIAHDETEKGKRPSDCYQLTTYRDYRKYYNPVRNVSIHNYGLPHRTKFELDKHFGVAYYQYMFQSPQHGSTHLEKWQPTRPLVRTNIMNQNGNILLRPFSTVSGEVAVLEELGVDCSGDIPSSINRESTAQKYVQAASVLPLLRRIEKEAIGETIERINQEAESGVSEEKIKLSAQALKAIDDEMTKNNSSCEGNIVWLKRSNCQDPQWLEKPPDVLPNPKLWRNMLEQEDDNQTATANTSSNSKHTAADITEARKRLLAFTRGASDMAATANEVLALVASSGIPVDEDEDDIVKATRQFRQRCLTKKEVQFYESMKSVKLITATAERRALEEEKRPWRLLNLPTVSAETRARMLAVQQHRAQQLAETEKNIKEILARRGEGEYDPNQQVVAFDGFIPTEPAKDLDKMTKDELVTLAKGHIKNVRAMKKPELLKALKEFMVKNPGKILLGTERALMDHGDDEVIDNEEDGDENIDASMSCSIKECDGTPLADMVHCDTCDLWFCKDLHGPHSSHSAQTHFKEGRAPKKVDDVILEEPIERILSDSIDANNESQLTEMILEEPSERILSNSIDVNNGSQSTEMITGTKRRRSQIETGASCDMVKVDAAVNKLRGILECPSKTQKDQLRSALNFTSYDIEFLSMLAKALDIDISSVASKHRASRVEVMDYLLSKLE